jgi:hypothetical protein
MSPARDVISRQERRQRARRNAPLELPITQSALNPKGRAEGNPAPV